jgi:hypothetical protein
LYIFKCHEESVLLMRIIINVLKVNLKLLWLFYCLKTFLESIVTAEFSAHKIHRLKSFKTIFRTFNNLFLKRSYTSFLTVYTFGVFLRKNYAANTKKHPKKLLPILTRHAVLRLRKLNSLLPSNTSYLKYFFFCR